MSTVAAIDKEVVNFGWNFSNYFQVFLIILVSQESLSDLSFPSPNSLHT